MPTKQAAKQKPSAQSNKLVAVTIPLILLAILAAGCLTLGIWLVATQSRPDSTNYRTISMEVGQSRTLETALTDNFTCNISDHSIAELDDAHLITALSPGTATIVAMTPEGARQVFYLTVTGTGSIAPMTTTTTTATTTTLSTTSTTTTVLAPGSVTGITLTIYSVSLKVGEKKMPIVTMTPKDATDKSEKWTSSDEKVATVNNLGNITAVAAGTCTVRVTSVNNPNVFADVAVTVTGATAEAETETKDGRTYVKGVLIANKTYALPADYNPGVNAEAKAAFDKMQVAAAEEMLDLYISSGFRSYATQQATYQRFVKRDGQEKADTYSARPGHSEHQTGLAFDLNTVSASFANTAEAKWVAENAHRFGFILRYPLGKEAVTGYDYEPWHIRYLGVPLAEEVYASGKTLEEYFGISSVYA